MKVRSTVKPPEFEITPTSIFVASNITPYKEEFDGRVFEGYEYDCTEYTKDEYLLQLARENAELKQNVLDTQMALVELYEAGELV